MTPTPSPLPSPGQPMPHNPDNLTPEQIGTADGWRLLDEDEITEYPNRNWNEIQAWIPSQGKWDGGYGGTEAFYTYRTRLTRAELRKARGLEPEAAPLPSPTPRYEALMRSFETAPPHAMCSMAMKEVKALERENAKLRAERDNFQESVRLLSITAQEAIAERDALKSELAYMKLQRDALLEMTWLDLPAEPSESTHRWKEEFAKGWERRTMLDDAKAELDRVTREKDAAISRRDEWLIETRAALARANAEAGKLRGAFRKAHSLICDYHDAACADHRAPTLEQADNNAEEFWAVKEHPALSDPGAEAEDKP